ncbi:hypothetical protein B0H12DRAFT_1100422 [Mycena haematopus]|nr:hypothetical protein B0H12DRAFT_1100422 [Mycena haematopus]
MLVASIETALLTGKWEAPARVSEITDLAKSVVDGDFGAALRAPLAKKLLVTVLSNDTTGSSLEDDAIRLIVAVACLHSFIQVNWTGPELDFQVRDVLQSASAEDDLNRRAVSELAYGGEPAYHLTRCAMLLRLAQLLFDLPSQHCQSLPWWRLRAALVHQQILDEPAPPPHSILSAIEPLIPVYASNPELAGRLELEQGLLQHLLSQDKLAAEFFVNAARSTGMQYELTGALGKRTKFQTNELSQLVLLAESQLKIEETSSSIEPHPPEQMTPYVSRVISHPLNWSPIAPAPSSARRSSCRPSSSRCPPPTPPLPNASATCTRSRSQATSAPCAPHSTSSSGSRCGRRSSSAGRRWSGATWLLASCGICSRDAKPRQISSWRGGRQGLRTPDARTMDLAREAKLWCLLGDLEPEHAAEHYQRAWTVSGQTAGRAMRSLGGYYFARAEYPEAIACLKKAVGINPLLSRSWFILGCACMRVEDWVQAKAAFSRCVSIDEEDGESWSNLASMYMRMGTDKTTDDDSTDAAAVPFENKLLAFRALKQGLRSAYENWRMWYNYMIVAVEVGELSEACRAQGRVIEQRGEEGLDEDVLELLVTAVTRAPTAEETDGDASEAAQQTTSNPNEGRGLLRPVKHLLEDIVLPRISSSPRVFRAYARFLIWECRWDEALKASMDAYRCSTAGTMGQGETDVKKWRDAIPDVEDIVDALQNFGPRSEGDKLSWRLQARSIVRTFMGKTKDSFGDEPEWTKLQGILDELKKRAAVDD